MQMHTCDATLIWPIEQDNEINDSPLKQVRAISVRELRPGKQRRPHRKSASSITNNVIGQN
jgi:hypothetical protein